MGFIQAIIDFFMKLFGMAKDEPAALPGAAATPAASASSSNSSSREDEDEDREKTPAERKAYVEKEFAELQAFAARCEAQGIDLKGLDVSNPETYWQKLFAFEGAQQDGAEPEQAYASIGFSKAEWENVSQYFQAKWSHITTDSDGMPEVNVKDEFTNAAMKARMGQTAAAQAAAAAADPNLLAPVDGISVDTWATAAVAMTKLPMNATAADVNKMLAAHGMDRAKWDRINDGWMAKMQGDVTGAIATKYGAAFTSAQGQTADGPEPCTFERFCEVGAAQAMWAEQGLDVNAQLQKVFTIKATDWSMYGAYWSPRMSTDIALARSYSDLDAKYRQKYKGAAMDDDLSL
jgi:hypothetical protein